MHLTRLFLRNFRNYKEAELTFSPFVNSIEGGNGQGKTNLLEALHLVSTGRSFRTAKLNDLIRFGETFFYIEADFIKNGISQQIKIYCDETTRKVQCNQTIYPSLTNLLGNLPSVLLSPEDHSLLSGAPERRRRFLDLYIAQTDPLYVSHLARYYRAMKQRNHLLRQKSQEAIESWEEMMAQSSAYLMIKRKEAIENLKIPSQEWMERLSEGKEVLKIVYDTSLHCHDLSKEAFILQWQRHRPKELHLGSTTIGPHRDDLSFLLGDKSAKSFSSEGQKRTCATALRFAEWEELKNLSGHPPILGIDDFGIQLDGKRRTSIQRHFKQFSQVFLTSPLPLDRELFEAEHRIFHVREGIMTNA